MSLQMTDDIKFSYFYELNILNFGEFIYVDGANALCMF